MTLPYVYYYDFVNDSHTLDELEGCLGEQRFAYCSRMKNRKACMASAFSFLLLRYALKKEYGITAIPEFTFNEHGKPFLKEYPGIFFSMSHSDTRVVCAVSDMPVGADIQDIRKLSESVAKKFLSPGESAAISEVTDDEHRNSELCRLWCIKESYSKMTGKGFSEGFCSIDTPELISSGRAVCISKDGFFISVCVQEVV